MPSRPSVRADEGGGESTGMHRDNMRRSYLTDPTKPHCAALEQIPNAYAGNLAAAIDHTADNEQRSAHPI